MRNEQIGTVLKAYRKANNLKVRELGVILREEYHINVQDKTIYGWESNQAHPTSDTFLTLCEFYQIEDVPAAFCSKELPASARLTKEERRLIKAYRKHPAMQQAIKQLLEME
jgi:transcriptional regulator with XRE-family HTH domain